MHFTVPHVTLAMLFAMAGLLAIFPSELFDYWCSIAVYWCTILLNQILLLMMALAAIPLLLLPSFLTTLCKPSTAELLHFMQTLQQEPDNSRTS